MINVFIVGFNGKMGQLVFELTKKRSSDWHSYCGFDLTKSKQRCVYTSMEKLMSDAFTVGGYTDVFIDFSAPSATMEILPFAVEKEIPMVIGTTGFTQEQEEEIANCAKTIPIFKSDNMAYSSEVFTKLVKQAAKLLPEYEVSIIETPLEEKHGTLQINYEGDDKLCVSTKRIEHFPTSYMVTIAGANSFIILQHNFIDREIFAEGALNAAKFIVYQDPGLYTMKDLLKANK